MTSSADRCGVCGLRLTWAKTGRPARYCGPTCRSRAHRRRLAAERERTCYACSGPLAGSDGLCAICRSTLDALPLVTAAGRRLDAPPCSCGLCPESRP